jgi:hypothetical protein
MKQDDVEGVNIVSLVIERELTNLNHLVESTVIRAIWRPSTPRCLECSLVDFVCRESKEAPKVDASNPLLVAEKKIVLATQELGPRRRKTTASMLPMHTAEGVVRTRQPALIYSLSGFHHDRSLPGIRQEKQRSRSGRRITRL